MTTVAVPATEATAPVAQTATARSSFIVSPGFDAFFFIGSALVVLLAWAAITVFHLHPFHVLAIVAVTSNAPHLTSTWTRAYGDGALLRSRPIGLVVIPLVLMSGVFYTATFVRGGWKYLYTVLIFWATWHFVAQCYGLLRLYQRRDGAHPGAAPTLAMRLESASLFLFTAYCLSMRLRNGPWDLFGVTVWHPSPPLAAIHAMGLLAGAAFVSAMALNWTRNRRLPWVRVLFLLACYLAFYVPFNVIPYATAGFAAAACWHGFQYLGIVWHFNRNRFRGKPPQSPRALWWVCQPRRQVLYFATLLAMAGSVYGLIFGLSAIKYNMYHWGAVIWTGLTLAHYWVDGLIWKFKKTNLAAQLSTAPAT